jgi:hypothetical protein
VKAVDALERYVKSQRILERPLLPASARPEPETPDEARAGARDEARAGDQPPAPRAIPARRAAN